MNISKQVPARQLIKTDYVCRHVPRNVGLLHVVPMHILHCEVDRMSSNGEVMWHILCL